MNGNPEHGEFAVPANLSLIVDYCADPNYALVSDSNPYNQDSIPVPSGTLCSQLPTYFSDTSGTNFTWFPN